MATMSEGSVTFIGTSVQVRGNLSGDEDLHVLGRIEGSIQLERTLVVAKSGIVKAEVRVRNAVVSGVVVGNIHATESVEVTQEGRMVGDIVAPRVIIVDGASFRGNVDMGDIANMASRPPRRERPVASPTPAPRAAKVPQAAKAAPEQAEAAKPAAPERPAPAAASPAPAAPKAAPHFLSPPKAKGLPSKKQQKSRVVVKRK
jgi:cytoskeletal protein CcmA (bactofilin family)